LTGKKEHVKGTRTAIRPIGERRVAIDFLVGLLNLKGEPASQPPISPEHWEAVAAEALRYRLGPLTFQRATGGPHPAEIPADTRELLKQACVRNGFRNAILARQTAAAARALGEIGIPVMLLKGQHLAWFEYADPAFRSMADIDIMVPRDRLADAERVLVSMGYGPDPRPDLESFCAWSNQLAKFEKDGAEVIELHYAIERPTSPFRIDTADLWLRAVPSKHAGADVVRLATEDLLLHLCLHLAYHHQFDRAALKGLVDIATVVSRNETAIDWAVLVERARDWAAAPFVRCSLELSRRLLGAPVPFDILAALGPDDGITDTVEAHVLAPVVELPASIDERLRGERGGTRRPLLTSVFLPPSKMRERYGLVAGSQRVWLWYLVRIADLITRRGPLMARLFARTQDVRPTLDRDRDREIIRQWVDRNAPGAGSSGDRMEAAN
jgi:Uncharacterised nucleotidyltransferase